MAKKKKKKIIGLLNFKSVDPLEARFEMDTSNSAVRSNGQVNLNPEVLDGYDPEKHIIRGEYSLTVIIEDK